MFPRIRVETSYREPVKLVLHQFPNQTEGGSTFTSSRAHSPPLTFLCFKHKHDFRATHCVFFTPNIQHYNRAKDNLDDKVAAGLSYGYYDTEVVQ